MTEPVDDRVVIVLALVPTQSSPGTCYVVTREGRGAACSCPAFRFSRAAPKTCKHLTALWHALDDARGEAA